MMMKFHIVLGVIAKIETIRHTSKLQKVFSNSGLQLY